MNFAIFLASFILIVQQLTIGLPITESQVKNSCSEGFIMVNDRCVPYKIETNNNGIESSTNVVIRQEKSINDCPKGMENNENDVCQEIKYSPTIEMAIESTTIFDDNSTIDENLSRCPEGTKRDEQGSCQEIESSNATRRITDPKVLLEKDGSCPNNYKKVEGQCLYIKPKKNSTNLITNTFTSNTVQSKSGYGERIKYESIPVLSDNSCPEGTEYSQYGLCQRPLSPTDSNRLIKTDEACPENFIFIDGKCLNKTLKKQDQYKETSTIPSRSRIEK